MDTVVVDPALLVPLVVHGCPSGTLHMTECSLWCLLMPLWCCTLLQDERSVTASWFLLAWTWEWLHVVLCTPLHPAQSFYLWMWSTAWFLMWVLSFCLATVCGWHLHIVASFIVASLTSSRVSCFTGWRTTTVTSVHSLPPTLSARSVLTLCQHWPTPFLRGTWPQCHTSVSVRACLEDCMVLCPMTSWW